MIAALLLAAVVTSPADGSPARLSPDGTTLIVQEESERQPRVAFTVDRATGTREVNLFGRARVLLPTLELLCTGAVRRTLPLIASETTAEGTTSCYKVAPAVARLALLDPECRLVLVGSLVSVPRDLLARVWEPKQQVAAPARVLDGEVVSVVDGDTIHVRIGSQTEAVRYIGINAPELGHPTRGPEAGGQEAAEANSALVQGERVRLELDVQERDRYGRLLASVYVGETMVNAELVRRGFAQTMTVPPNVRHQALFTLLEREARAARRGLWAPPESAASVEAPAPHPAAAKDNRPGVPPASALTCPASHPIKGNFTTYSGERCIYHVPGGQFYNRTKPERCYVTGDEARQDGCRRSKR